MNGPWMGEDIRKKFFGGSPFSLFYFIKGENIWFIISFLRIVIKENIEWPPGWLRILEKIFGEVLRFYKNKLNNKKYTRRTLKIYKN